MLGHSIPTAEKNHKLHRRFIVTESTGCDDPNAFEDIYTYYAEPSAWRLTTPDAIPALTQLRQQGALRLDPLQWPLATVQRLICVLVWI
jgi:hypothetical protein